MKGELERHGTLYQETAVYYIYRNLGKEFTYINENGNLAIGRGVLREFRRLTEPGVVWERAERCWRRRAGYDPQAGRAVD